MPWEGTHDQHEALWQALDQILREQRIPAARLAAVINADSIARQAHTAWADGRGERAQVIDDGTLTRWHERGAKSLKRALSHKKQIVYDFLERSDQPRTLLYRPQEGFPPGLGEFAAHLGAQLRKPLSKDLSDLDGNYRIFRPAWTIGEAETQRVMVSRLRIKTSGGFTRFIEEQRFTDPDAPHISVNQTDEGAALDLGGNIVLFGFSREVQGCKFYAAWSVFPAPGDGNRVNRLRGTMMGVVGAGPHPSYPFVAYRVDERFDAIKTGIVKPSDRLLTRDIVTDLGIKKSD